MFCPLRPTRAVALAAAMTVLVAVSAHAQFNAVSDFSTAANPNGAWRYGTTTTLGGTFSLLTTTTNTAQFASYQNPGGFPFIGKNITSGTLISGTVTVPNDVLWMHPNNDATYSVVRWIAPTAGTYTIAGNFQALDRTTTDVNIRFNSATSLFAANIDSPLTNPDPATSVKSPFNVTQVFAVGDTLDFAVGRRGEYSFDSTGLKATITASAAPEASAVVLFSLGMAAVGIMARRRAR